MKTFISEFNPTTGEITKCNLSFSGDIVLEPEYDGVKIVSFGQGSCSYGHVKSINMASTFIKTISKEAFLGCSFLTEIIFPETLESIREHAFAHSSLKSLDLPSGLLSFNPSCVNQVSTIFSITIKNSELYSSDKGFIFDSHNVLLFAPRNITTEQDIPRINQIPDIASYSLTFTQLKSFNGSSSLSNLQDAAFHAMNKIKIIDLRRTQITELKPSLFYGNSVETLYLPECLVSIKGLAFRETSSLNLLVLFSKVTAIENGAITSCNNLKTIIYFGSTDFSNTEIFSNMNSIDDIKIYVTDSYKASKFGLHPVDFNWYRKDFFPNCNTFNHERVIFFRKHSFSFLFILLHI